MNLVEVFASLPEDQRVEIVATFLSNEVFHFASAATKVDSQESLDALKANIRAFQNQPLIAALPDNEKAKYDELIRQVLEIASKADDESDKTDFRNQAGFVA